MNVYNYDKFVEQCGMCNITVNQEQLERLVQYYELLVERNKVMNLTAITEIEEVFQKHFLDSLAIGSYLPLDSKKTVIDVGTGAGFPGIPLKIIYPQLKITLLDSLNKRVVFLEEVVDKLGLKEVTCVHGRAEDYAKQSLYREQYDLCVSRAVANLASLSEYCLPFVKVNGYFVPYKSGSIDEEISTSKTAIKLLGGTLEKKEKFRLPESEIDRSLLFIKKIKNTSKKYPRKAGLPTKEPLR